MSARPPNATAATDAEDRGPTYRAFLIAMLIITIAAVSLRFWSRSLGSSRNPSPGSPRRYWWDDWAALSALPFMLTQLGLSIAMVHAGLGKHVWMVEEDDLALVLRIVYANYYTYDLALFLTKASALLFYSRVFPYHATETWFKVALYVVHSLNICWLLGIIFGTIFMCDPVQQGWDPTRGGTCGDTSALWIGSAVPSVVLDLMILLLPMPMIWGLRMSKARKGGISIIFLLGYCVIVVSLGRLITLFMKAEGLNSDITYESIPISLWVAAEAPITMLSICLPAMLPLGRHLAASYLSPLVNSMSSLLGSRRSGDSYVKSRNGTFDPSATSGGASADYHLDGGIQLRSKKSANLGGGNNSSGRVDEHDSVYSASDTRGILPPTTRVQHSAVRAGGEREHMPSHSIHVQRDFEVRLDTV